MAMAEGWKTHFLAYQCLASWAAFGDLSYFCFKFTSFPQQYAMTPSPWKCWCCSAFTAHEDKTQKMHFCPIKNRPRFCCSCQGLPTALCLFSTTAHLKMFLSISSPAFHCLETALRNSSVWKTCRWYKTHCIMTAPLLAVLQHLTSLCSCWRDECKRALRVFLALHIEISNWVTLFPLCFSSMYAYYTFIKKGKRTCRCVLLTLH